MLINVNVGYKSVALYITSYPDVSCRWKHLGNVFIPQEHAIQISWMKESTNSTFQTCVPKVGTPITILPGPLPPPPPHSFSYYPGAVCSPPHFNILSRAPWIMELVLIKPSFRSFSCSSGLSAAPIRQKALLSEFPNVAQHLLKWNSSSNCPPRYAPCLPLTSRASCSQTPPIFTSMTQGN